MLEDRRMTTFCYSSNTNLSALFVCPCPIFQVMMEETGCSLWLLSSDKWAQIINWKIRAFTNSLVNKWFPIAVVTDFIVSDEDEWCCELIASQLVPLQLLLGLDLLKLVCVYCFIQMGVVVVNENLNTWKPSEVVFQMIPSLAIPCEILFLWETFNLEAFSLMWEPRLTFSEIPPQEKQKCSVPEAEFTLENGLSCSIW